MTLRPGGRWGLRERATAIVLAGGSATRMGCDKALLPVEGRPLVMHVIEQLRPHFERVILSARSRDAYEAPGIDVVADVRGGEGPLMGIACGLRASTDDLNLVVACDIPEIDMPLARRLLREADGFDAVVPRHGENVEPLFAVYRRTLVERIDEMLAAGHRRIRAVLDRSRVRWVEIPDSAAVGNLNTRDDYAAYLARRREPG